MQTGTGQASNLALRNSAISWLNYNWNADKARNWNQDQMTPEMRTYLGNLSNSPKLFNSKLSRSMQNINKSLSGLPPISRHNEGVDSKCEIVVNECSIKPPSYEPSHGRLESTFEDDSSASFWVSPWTNYNLEHFQVKVSFRRNEQKQMWKTFSDHLYLVRNVVAHLVS